MQIQNVFFFIKNNNTHTLLLSSVTKPALLMNLLNNFKEKNIMSLLAVSFLELHFSLQNSTRINVWMSIN